MYRTPRPDAGDPHVSQTHFEGSYLGNAARITDAARLESKIYGYVYDPAAGDPVWQIPPQTPFPAPPDHWRRPEGDSDR